MRPGSLTPMDEQGGPTVVLVEDHAVLVEGLEMTLTIGGFEVVGSTGDPDEALAMIQSFEPDIALVDIFLGKGNGIALARKVRDRVAGTSVVLYTGYEDLNLVLESLDAGVDGYVLKDRPPQELIGALETVAGGELYLDPRLESALMARGASEVVRLALDLLSPLAVVRGLAEQLERDADELNDDQREAVTRIAIAAADMHDRLQRRLAPPNDESRTAPVPMIAVEDTRKSDDEGAPHAGPPDDAARRGPAD
jgi:DNA-binding NarL/FixJ family response regulator